MEYSEIEKKWLSVTNVGDENYSSVQLATDIRVRLFLAYDKNKKHCLILSLLNTEKFDLKNNFREHISLQYFDQSGHIIITLNDDRFTEQFNAFVYSVYINMKPISTNKDAVWILIKTYNKWSDFFSEIISSTLSTQEVMGLWGELFYLRGKINGSVADEADDILKCWVGPFGKSHDFEFPESDIEVKTKLEGVKFVNISSEYQLDNINDKPLHLHVISVDNNGKDGLTLGQLVKDIYEILSSKLVDTSFLIKALLRAGLPWQDIDRYNEYVFSVQNESTYDCMNINFPKLIRSKLPLELLSIRYALNLENLSDFITIKVNY